MERKRERGYGDGDAGGDHTRKRRRDPAYSRDASHSPARSPSRSASTEHDDTVGHLSIRAGDRLSDKYVVLGESGTGTFGKVLLCEELSSGATVAIKVVRRIDKYTACARIEADVLKDVNDADPVGVSHCVRFHHAFEHRGHYCMVFEPLGPSLYDYIRANDYLPPPLYCVQAFADQLITAVAFLHEMRLIHTDLKLENVLLVSRDAYVRTSKPMSSRKPVEVLAPRKTDIKLIDFGGATYDWEHKSSIINTRQYRAPEVILGLGWSMPSDVWSLGCILMELYTGELLFQTHDNAEHLALMEAILGPLPSVLTQQQRGPEVRKYFDKHGRQRFPDTASRESLRVVREQRRLDQLVHPRDTVFCDLIRGMLAYDPATRMTAKEAMNHRFFTAVRNVKELPHPAVIPTQPAARASSSGATAAAHASSAAAGARHGALHSSSVLPPSSTASPRLGATLDPRHVVYVPPHTQHRDAGRRLHADADGHTIGRGHRRSSSREHSSSRSRRHAVATAGHRRSRSAGSDRRRHDSAGATGASGHSRRVEEDRPRYDAARVVARVSTASSDSAERGHARARAAPRAYTSKRPRDEVRVRSSSPSPEPARRRERERTRKDERVSSTSSRDSAPKYDTAASGRSSGKRRYSHVHVEPDEEYDSSRREEGADHALSEGLRRHRISSGDGTSVLIEHAGSRKRREDAGLSMEGLQLREDGEPSAHSHKMPRMGDTRSRAYAPDASAATARYAPPQDAEARPPVSTWAQLSQFTSGLLRSLTSSVSPVGIRSHAGGSPGGETEVVPPFAPPLRRPLTGSLTALSPSDPAPRALASGHKDATEAVAARATSSTGRSREQATVAVDDAVATASPRARTSAAASSLLQLPVTSPTLPSTTTSAAGSSSLSRLHAV